MTAASTATRDVAAASVERIVVRDDRTIAIETLGDRSTSIACVAIHGGPGYTSASMRSGLAALAREHAVTVFDLPGCGRSSRHPGTGYPLDAFIADLHAVIDAVASHVVPSRVIVIAHAWGAILAIEAARRASSRIGGLVLVNPLRILNEHGQDEVAQRRRIDAVDPSLIPRFRALSDVIGRARAGDVAAWDGPELARWSHEMFATMFAGPMPDEWRAAMHGARLGLESYAAYKGAALADEHGAWGRYDLRDAAREIVQPVLVVASDGDANYVAPPRRHARPLVDAMPDAELVAFDTGGHFVFAEEPVRFAACVDDWIRRRIA